MPPFFNTSTKTHSMETDCDRHVFLIGFMGSGKTTVGKALASLLGREFLDLDDLLETEYGKTIAEVFSDPTLGEVDFRKREANKIRGLLDIKGSPKVIALGGGSVVNPQIRNEIKDKALTFYLATDNPQMLFSRILKQNELGNSVRERPNAKEEEKFEKLFYERVLFYRSSGIPIDASLPPETSALMIANKITKREVELNTERTEKCLIKTFLTKDSMLRELKRTIGQHKCLLLLDHALSFEREIISRACGPQTHVYQTQRRGEEAKTLPELEAILRNLSLKSFDRSDYLVARGGGSLSDLGALAAGLFKRGINLIILPSTLLSAVDAAIGGKAAVNFQGAKNQIGLFYLPKMVAIDGETLGRLSPKLLSEGLTEAFKMGLIMDKMLYELITRNFTSLIRPHIKSPIHSHISKDQNHSTSLTPNAAKELELRPNIPLLPFEKTPSNDIPLILDIAFRSASLRCR
jgi:shikimate kinase